MTTLVSPPFVRRELGRVLKSLRERARLSFSEAHRRLEFSSATLSRIETGKTAPTVHTARSMLDLYLVPANEWDEVLDLVRQSKASPWWKKYMAPRHGRYPSMALGFTELEAAAGELSSFELAYLPGHFQTSAYAREVLRASLLDRSPQHFENQVALRLERQRRLFEVENPARLHSIIDESALLRRIGSPELMVEQLAKIEQLAGLPSVTVQIVPSSTGVHLGFAGVFTILTFPSPEEPNLVYLEHAAGSEKIDRPDQVEIFERTFASILGRALDPAESIALLGELRADLERHGWR
ncbi:helix-turn-helix domain-containing protein [Amycolatopsis anabasis]|uniref:helix-turn-helix domain-containing protein n=1 Tax=Amycolatopsis anabasis TaxID=1840409 RepID=UPI00131A8BD6|nr:helix-turn-helix transcriptional regulator [Amycolatopsis anabasis]